MRRTKRCVLLLCLFIASVILKGCAGDTLKGELGPAGSVISQAVTVSDKYLVSDDGYRLPYSFKAPLVPPKALVIALHGFNDYRVAFDDMCEYLVSAAIACLAYDQRGFGETEGRGVWAGEQRMRDDLRNFAQYWAKSQPDTPIILLGESMGGAVIMSAIADDPAFYAEHISGSVLLAPAVWGRSTQPWYQRWMLWVAVHTFPAWSPTGEGLGVQATDNFEALRAMSQDPNVIKKTRIDSIYGLTNLMDDALASSAAFKGPSLILYGQRDEVIPVLPTCEMLQAMNFHTQNIAFKSYENGYHMLSRDLQAENVFFDIVAWVDSPAGEGASGEAERKSLCSSLD